MNKDTGYWHRSIPSLLFQNDLNVIGYHEPYFIMTNHAANNSFAQSFDACLYSTTIAPIKAPFKRAEQQLPSKASLEKISRAPLQSWLCRPYSHWVKPSITPLGGQERGESTKSKEAEDEAVTSDSCLIGSGESGLDEAN